MVDRTAGTVLATSYPATIVPAPVHSGMYHSALVMVSLHIDSSGQDGPCTDDCHGSEQQPVQHVLQALKRRKLDAVLGQFVYITTVFLSRLHFSFIISSAGCTNLVRGSDMHVTYDKPLTT